MNKMHVHRISTYTKTWTRNTVWVHDKFGTLHMRTHSTRNVSNVRITYIHNVHRLYRNIIKSTCNLDRPAGNIHIACKECTYTISASYVCLTVIQYVLDCTYVHEYIYVTIHTYIATYLHLRNFFKLRSLFRSCNKLHNRTDKQACTYVRIIDRRKP